MKVLKEGEVVILEDGNWYALPTNNMYQRCCRCGFSHFWEFEKTENGIRICATAISDQVRNQIETEYQNQIKEK